MAAVINVIRMFMEVIVGLAMLSGAVYSNKVLQVDGTACVFIGLGGLIVIFHAFGILDSVGRGCRWVFSQ